MEVCINPLSANGQFKSVEEIEQAVSELVESFKFMRPALERRMARVVYDDSIEMRGLMIGSGALVEDIHKIGNGDVRTQWFLYTKNRSVRAAGGFLAVILSSETSSDVVEGTLRDDIYYDEARWLSFSSSPPSDQSRLNVLQVESGGTISGHNACTPTELRGWWPTYERSDKHRKEGYWREGGEWVSPMPLDDGEAQYVLLISVTAGADRYAIYEGLFYRFVKTHRDKEVFHGFVIERREVPNAALDFLEP